MAINIVDTRALPIMPTAQWRALIGELAESGQPELAARALAQYRRFYGDHDTALTGELAGRRTLGTRQLSRRHGKGPEHR